MPVPESQKRRYPWPLLSVAILAGCMAQAQPEAAGGASFAGQPQTMARVVTPQPHDWIVAPPLRASSADFADSHAEATPQPGWMTAMQAPVRLRSANPPPLRREAPVTAPAKAAPMIRQSLNEAPSLRTTSTGTSGPAPASAAPTAILHAPDAGAPDVGPAPQTVWNIAPPADLKPAPAPSIPGSRMPPAGSGTLAAEVRVPSPESGMLLPRP